MKKFLRRLLLASSLSLAAGCGGGANTSRGGPPATQLSVKGPTSSAAGFAFSFTVTARDATNALAASYSGIAHFTSSDPAAVLPPDSALLNGTGTFSATLTNAGFQTLTATDTVSPSLTGSLSLTTVAGEFPVASFGALGDGHTDDTAAIQKAINAAGAAGGGSVVLGVARYFTAGTLVVPAGVVLCGSTTGPFDAFGIDPTRTAAAATLLVTNTTGPFLTLQGIGAGVTDVVFHYPNQVAPTASAPNVYPYTILVTAPGTKVVRSMVTNAYDFLDVESGRVLVQDMSIAAFHNDIKVDHAYDHVTLRNLAISVSWDTVGNYPYPQLIDDWVMSNGTAFLVGRADSLEVSSVIVFVRFTGMLLTDSTDISQSVRCGYGTGNDIDLDTVQYGVVVTASNAPGYKFTNVDIGSGNGGQAAVQLGTGGSMPPKIEINGGSQRGYWALGAYPPPGPDTIIVNILP